MSIQQKNKIVIVGGGAGGLELATRLGDTLGRRARAEITLVDANLTHTWKPLLHEVAAGTLNSREDELSYLAQARAHHFEFRLGRVVGVNRTARTIHTEPTRDQTGAVFVPARSFPYDTLILAVGSIANDFGIPGVHEHCHFLDRRAQADNFQQHLLRMHYAADTQESPLRPGQLGIAIAGGGATGVELAAELYHCTRELIQYLFAGLKFEKHMRITVVDGADRVLPGLPARLGEQVAEELRHLGITVLTGERIIEARADGFVTAGGKVIAAETLVWAAGIKAADFLTRIEGLECNRTNQLLVLPTLQTTRDRDIFAFGDCAACPMPDGSAMVPPRAQAAHQQAAMLVKSMHRRLEQRSLPRYRYVDYGSLINLSRYSTVGSLMGNLARYWSPRLFVEGVFARLVYLSLYKMHLLALHGFVPVALTTLANLLTRRARPRLKLH
ncbi:MAG: NAD(P)/FAD-dependent oxidoreductase [Gammaproteobacteria bacterium]|nr:NAD(P)/FAD-dependent oxidoreductase [Gammaproteobacteria bacterium]